MNIPMEDIYVNQDEKIELYVIGYESMGESIILNIADKFIGVIDCYRTKNLFITKQILEEKGIKNLDFICWTHTDIDHTKGMIELFDYVNDETAFIMPEGISYKELLTNLTLAEKRFVNKEMIDIFQAIEEKIKDYNFVSANNGNAIYCFNLKSIDDDKVLTLNIESFAPISSIVRKSQINTIQELIDNSDKLHEKPNLYSVGLLIKFTFNSSSLSVCLTGDVDNITIQNMHPKNRKFVFGNNHIIKLPHHGSLNSDIIIKENIIKYFDFAVSTGYKKHGLPKKEILDNYKKCCPTGIISRTNYSSGPYGYVLYKMPIFRWLEEDTELIYDGTAGEV